MKTMQGVDAETYINNTKVANEYEATVQDEGKRVIEVYAHFDYDEYYRLRELLRTVVDVRITGVLSTVKAEFTGISIRASVNDIVDMNISLKEI